MLLAAPRNGFTVAVAVPFLVVAIGAVATTVVVALLVVLLPGVVALLEVLPGALLEVCVEVATTEVMRVVDAAAEAVELRTGLNGGRVIVVTTVP